MTEQKRGGGAERQRQHPSELVFVALFEIRNGAFGLAFHFQGLDYY